MLNLTIAALLDSDDQPLTSALDALNSDAPQPLLGFLEPLPDDVDPKKLENSGYVLSTLQTALYHILTADSAESAIVNAVNQGGDTDTIGAVAGAVADTRFGVSTLPERWLDALAVTDELPRSHPWAQHALR